jgi:hypothetical protein
MAELQAQEIARTRPSLSQTFCRHTLQIGQSPLAQMHSDFYMSSNLLAIGYGLDVCGKTGTSPFSHVCLCTWLAAQQK